ncbi:TOMM precursor leader peptide-binding protein [Streptomyces zagrosensis]|uniref:Bacteriocin biosynthesis cyclodehydratase domain-containing protein n=1 Tax=Streptomyces zagrosensis TaxID=1042984 RepID=A0A7W9V0A7_9ACTN|nr:TOMM precursor leader peptide-binding protein [Streptomyces zagrosensis]MBB5937935.1 bacteriocin biosynthesis cyclodehydratase domain-containing protein [Streptomyces zagrosensis]
MVAAAYEEIAQTRPRIRRDVLFTETPDGVLFHNAQGGFHLNAKSAYRFSTLIVPYFDGRHRVADLCASLGDQQRAMVAGLVKTLYERDFARDVPAGSERAESPVDEAVATRFAAQIDYIDHYADDAATRFQRFRDTRVAILGDDLIARWAALSLIRNGCATVAVLASADTPRNQFADVIAEAKTLADEGCPARIELLDGKATPAAATGAPGAELDWAALADYDTVLVTGGHNAPRRMHQLLSSPLPEGKRLIPVWSLGRRAVVGPLTARDASGCWHCAVLRLGGNGDAGEAADLWRSLALGGGHPSPAGREPGRPLSAMLGNLLGYEVFRLATRALPAETEGQVIVQDMESLDVAAEPLLPHPGCPRCAHQDATDASDASDAATALRDGLANGPTTPVGTTVETARDADALVEELNARMVLVKPHAGVFTAFADEHLTQTPLKVTTISLATGHGGRREVSAFDVHHVAGARTRALYAAAEVYAEHVIPCPTAGTAGTADTAGTPDTTAAGEGAAAAGTSVEPGRLALASGLAPGHATGDGAQWVAGTSLLTKESLRVPAAAVRPFGAANRDRAFLPTRAGCGAGASVAEAAGRGLLSALAHDALQRALRGGSLTGVSLIGLGDGDPELTFLVRTADTLGVGLELLDLGECEHSSAHVLFARATDPGTGVPVWSVGADLVWRTAAGSAIRDLLGQVQLRRELPADAQLDTGDPLLGDLAPGTLVAATARMTGERPATTWSTVLDRLRAAGRDAIAVPTGAADLAAGGITTVRVLLTTGLDATVGTGSADTAATTEPGTPNAEGAGHDA